MLHILLLAAGRSSRMRGADKLMQLVDNRSLINTMCKRALATDHTVTVTLPVDAGARHQSIINLPLNIVPVPDTDLGMSLSIRTGINALPETATAAMVLPADMPDITTEDMNVMIATHHTAPDAILRGTSADGKPGHPVIFPRNCFADIANLAGDEGAKPVIRAFTGDIQMVALPANNALTDLDTPEEWAAWRARRSH
ncbi:nucleotidyltransferase family protein [Shimia abyssi]|uniref:CTP:molybdopterin cytidylyltransferase MocA n=1 Tax=Shimia abyssi TaxID=1662395 RepID=A0A2P8FG87_9RHOB|nr:nucleotidyltransferase family protein [Shimia abyssi]PSL20721.1 CTP:molybdopterin cytidylyltransferase MocA [Shimia abyssi]